MLDRAGLPDLAGLPAPVDPVDRADLMVRPREAVQVKVVVCLPEAKVVVCPREAAQAKVVACPREAVQAKVVVCPREWPRPRWRHTPWRRPLHLGKWTFTKRDESARLKTPMQLLQKAFATETTCAVSHATILPCQWGVCFRENWA